MAGYSEQQRTFTIAKTFSFPRVHVWEAWADPRQLIQWFAPLGTLFHVLQHNFHVGGEWKYSFPLPNNGSWIAQGVYEEISQHEKIVTTTLPNEQTNATSTQLLLEEQQARTFITLTITRQPYPSMQSVRAYFHWTERLKRLDDWLSGLVR